MIGALAEKGCFFEFAKLFQGGGQLPQILRIISLELQRPPPMRGGARVIGRFRERGSHTRMDTMILMIDGQRAFEGRKRLADAPGVVERLAQTKMGGRVIWIQLQGRRKGLRSFVETSLRQ